MKYILTMAVATLASALYFSYSNAELDKKPSSYYKIKSCGYAYKEKIWPEIKDALLEYKGLYQSKESFMSTPNNFSFGGVSIGESEIIDHKIVYQTDSERIVSILTKSIERISAVSEDLHNGYRLFRTSHDGLCYTDEQKESYHFT